METLYFVLGALSVVTAVAVVSVFKIKSELKEFTKSEINRNYDSIGHTIDGLESNLYRKIEDLEQLLDKKEHKLIDYADGLHNYSYEEINKLYGYIDSRNDKAADNVARHLAEIYKKLDLEGNNQSNTSNK